MSDTERDARPDWVDFDEPCGRGICAAEAGHRGTCAQASGWDIDVAEDAVTNTVDDAARFERERTRDAGEDDRPTLADCGEF